MQFDRRLRTLGVLKQHYEAEVPAGTRPDDVIGPEYWGRWAKDLKARDVIEVDAEDGEWTATVRVMGVDAHASRVLVAFQRDPVIFDAGPIPAGFALEFVSKNAGWRVMANGSNAPVRSGFSTKLEAANWLRIDRAVGASSPASSGRRERSVNVSADA